MNNNDTLVKWEYCKVVLHAWRTVGTVNFFQEDKIRTYTIPGKRKINEPPSAGWRYIAGLGKQGWELVSHSEDAESTFIFKRPIQSVRERGNNAILS